MQSMKKWMRVLALLLCAALLMTGAALCEETAAEDGNAVVATVNGKEVTQAEVDGILYNLMSYFSQMYDVSDPDIAMQLQALAEELAVQYEVMEQKAVELGLHEPSDEELAELEKQADEEWEQGKEYLALYGYDRDMILDELKYNFWYEKLMAYMVEGAQVSDAEVEAQFAARVEEDRASYEDNILMYEYMTQYYGQESYYTPAGYRGITHILLNVDEALMNEYQTLAAQLEEQSSAMEAGIVDGEETAAEPAEAPVTQEMVDAAKQAIMDSVQPVVDEIVAKLEGGASFEDLIAEYGNDPGMQDPGNLANGYSVHQDSVIWDPAFVEAAFSAKMQQVGDVADPILGSYGVHIVYYKRDVPAGTVEMTDDIAAAIRESLMANAENALYEEKMDAWMEEATIEYPVTDAE